VTNKVFFDVEIEGGEKGRIVLGLFGDDVPKTVVSTYCGLPLFDGQSGCATNSLYDRCSPRSCTFIDLFFKIISTHPLVMGLCNIALILGKLPCPLHRREGHWTEWEAFALQGKHLSSYHPQLHDPVSCFQKRAAASPERTVYVYRGHNYC
jgi:hypothetical protein